MPTFDPQAQKLFEKAEALKKQSEEVRAKAEAVLAKKYGQLGAIFAKRANEYLPSKKKDWEAFIDRVMTVYEQTLKTEEAEIVDETQETVEEVAETQLELAEAAADDIVEDAHVEERIEAEVVTDVSVVPASEVASPDPSPAPQADISEAASEFFGEDDILSSSPRRAPRNRAFSGGLNPPEGW